ncbi:MAG: maleylpyruvate isomerase N-terminal domain-containing protein [Candidatus Dormibacteria bacterium]
MDGTRAAFLAAAGVARDVAGHPGVTLRWEEPSALAEMTVGALVAHLARAVTNVDRLLNAPEPAGEEPRSAAAYFVPVGPDRDAEINVRVRATSAEEAVVGHRAVMGQMDRALERLRARLEGEPEGRLVKARDEVLGLDDYLRTRLIEIALHTDDLCVSLGRETPALPGIGVAIEALVEVAALRHGELAVLRALARRERDPDQVLRVI